MAYFGGTTHILDDSVFWGPLTGVGDQIRIIKDRIDSSEAGN